MKLLNWFKFRFMGKPVVVKVTIVNKNGYAVAIREYSTVGFLCAKDNILWRSEEFVSKYAVFETEGQAKERIEKYKKDKGLKKNLKFDILG